MTTDIVKWLRARQEQENRVALRVSGAGEAAELYGRAAAEIERLCEHLREADELLRIAYHAHQKMGLEGQGNRGLPHETRMFAMHFSQPETPKTPEHVILSGDGRYWRFRLRDKV